MRLPKQPFFHKKRGRLILVLPGNKCLLYLACIKYRNTCFTASIYNMTKNLLLFFTIVFFCKEGRSQWTTTNVGTTRNLYSVDYYSANELWLGGYNAFVKTTDAGAHWTVSTIYVPAVGDTLIGSPITDIATTGSG